MNGWKPGCLTIGLSGWQLILSSAARVIRAMGFPGTFNIPVFGPIRYDRRFGLIIQLENSLGR